MHAHCHDYESIIGASSASVPSTTKLEDFVGSYVDGDSSASPLKNLFPELAISTNDGMSLTFAILAKELYKTSRLDVPDPGYLNSTLAYELRLNLVGLYMKLARKYYPCESTLLLVAMAVRELRCLDKNQLSTNTEGVLIEDYDPYESDEMFLLGLADRDKKTWENAITIFDVLSTRLQKEDARLLLTDLMALRFLFSELPCIVYFAFYHMLLENKKRMRMLLLITFMYQVLTVLPLCYKRIKRPQQVRTMKVALWLCLSLDYNPISGQCLLFQDIWYYL